MESMGQSQKHGCIVAKLAYVFLLSYWLDNMFRPLHLGHHQVYKMFIRVQVNVGQFGYNTAVFL